jgi:multidrug efflux system membrane fusion protein
LATLQDALTIPDDAVQHGPEGLFVFVVDDANKARMQAITVSRSNDGRTLIGNGLTSGERVIETGHYRVQAGTVVADARENETAQAGPSPLQETEQKVQ